MISNSADVPWYKSYSRDDLEPAAIVATVVTDQQDSSFPVPSLTAISMVEESSAQTNLSRNQTEYNEPIEWSPKLEAKFYRLAQSHALNQLSLTGKVEFERLSALRSQLKNPRTGEEIVAEYEQRMLTRDLVQALAKYVKWHKQYASGNSR